VFFHRLFPFVDVDSHGSVYGVIAAVQSILQRVDPETSIIPGHGPLATPHDLRTYMRMLQESVQIVDAGVKAGKSLEELQATGVGSEWAGYSWGFISTESWVATLYQTVGGPQ
jgi:cyclase